MAYTMKTEGMDGISSMLEKIEKAAPAIASKALYEGAGIMAEEIRAGAEGIQTAPFRGAGRVWRYPSPEEKEILVEAGAGIAKFDRNGAEVDTSVGYSKTGYAELGTETKPIPLIANAINSGTSFMRKQPFFRKAARIGGQKAMAAMTRYIEYQIDKMSKE